MAIYNITDNTITTGSHQVDQPAEKLAPLQAPSRPNEKIGLLAGAGEFPMTFARGAREQGYHVFGVGVQGMHSEELAECCDEFKTTPLARLGTAIRHFKRGNVNHVVMAGKIEKKVLFQPWAVIKLLPDWRTLNLWYRYTVSNKKDDTILLAIIREFEKDGITFGSALDYCPEILVEHGFLTRKKPSSAQWKDIRFGWEIAKEMGRLDIGQTVVINNTAVVAVEAIEGTDQAILRAGELCEGKGFTVVKVAKPQQDMRFDVPTIGLDTIHNMHEAGGRVLAVEAGMTIFLEEKEVFALANKLGIAIVSLKAEEVELKIAS